MTKLPLQIPVQRTSDIPGTNEQYVNEMIQKVNKNVKDKILDVMPR